MPPHDSNKQFRLDGSSRERVVSLGELRQKVLRIVPGQKIAYVTDAVYSPANAG